MCQQYNSLTIHAIKYLNYYFILDLDIELMKNPADALATRLILVH